MNLFVYGQTGSGKDTISNYLRDKFGYSKMRIARTIKQVICEKYNISFDELEKLKRNNHYFRNEHHYVSKMLGNSASSMNRLHQLINGKSMDYEYVNFDKPKVICDVRIFEEAKLCLNNNYVGIFLTRRTDEYVAGHYTDKFMLTNGELDLLLREHQDKIIIIDNHKIKDVIKHEWDKITINTDGTPENLLKVVDMILATNNNNNITDEKSTCN